jgi:hypothetical protein
MYTCLCLAANELNGAQVIYEVAVKAGRPAIPPLDVLQQELMPDMANAECCTESECEACLGYNPQCHLMCCAEAMQMTRMQCVVQRSMTMPLSAAVCS